VVGLGRPGGGRTSAAGRGWGASGGGRGRDPSGKLAGSFREAGRNLPGGFAGPARAFWWGKSPQTKPATPAMALRLSRGERARRVPWPDPSGTVRERFEDDSRASGRRKGRQPRPAAPALAPSLAWGDSDRRGSWPDPSGKLAGSFGDGSRTIRERFEDDSRASGRRKGRQPGPAAPALARSRALSERDRRGPWLDPSGKLAVSFEDDSRTVRGPPGGERDVSPGPRPRRWRGAVRWASATGGNPGRILRGSWPDPSGTVRARFEDDSRASGRRKGRQPRPAPPALARSRAWGDSDRRGSWPDPSGTVRGRFEDDSRTIRGRFEGLTAAEAPSDCSPLCCTPHLTKCLSQGARSPA
jgi:hypothetical protein